MATNRSFKLYLIILLVSSFIYIEPQNLFAGTVMLNWNAPTTNADPSRTPLVDLAGYDIYYGTAPRNYSNSISVGKVTSYQISNLADGATYYFAVKAVDTAGNKSNFSPEVSISIPLVDSTPPVISGIYADAVTSSSALINWVTDELSDSQIEYGTDLSFGNLTVYDPTMTMAHSQTIGGLNPSTTYYYRVISADASNNESVSLYYTFATLPPADTSPPLFSNISTVNVSFDSVTITWVTDENATTQVEYGLTTAYGNLTPFDPLLKTIHSVTLAGLSSYTRYYFRVISADSSGNQAVSTESSFLTSNSPPVINSFYSKDDLSGYPTLKIKFMVDAIDYDGEISYYEWDFDGDGVYDKVTNKNKAKHKYSNIGKFNAVVRITDNGGASSISEALTVTVISKNIAMPVVDSIACTPNPDLNNPLTVICKTNISAAQDQVVAYNWDFEGNGQFNVTTDSTPIAHTYNDEGTYNAKLKVVSEDGAVITEETTITVSSSNGDTGSGTASGEDGGDGGGCFVSAIIDNPADTQGTGLHNNIEVNRSSAVLFMLWIALIGTAYFITIKD